MEVKNPLKDLAYIEILAMGVNWDADMAEDGVAIGIEFYDSNGREIRFKGIPIKVTIEFYGRPITEDVFLTKKLELLGKTEVSIDRSMEPDESIRTYIRIPYENIPVDRTKYRSSGVVKAIVTIPQRGNFEAIQDWVELYPES
jgi:hypothetical protein